MQFGVYEIEYAHHYAGMARTTAALPASSSVYQCSSVGAGGV